MDELLPNPPKTFWSDARWLTAVGRQCIEPYDEGAVEDANYLLTIGDEIYVSSPDTHSTIQRLTQDRPNFCIEPGQFAFLLTAEKVTIPFDAIGFISIRASIKFMGLVNISGFHVDPGYSGKLVFAVFNAGPTRIHLQRGQKLFPIWLADLDSQIRRKEPKRGYDRIPPKLITQISGDFTTAYQLKTQLNTIEKDVTDLKAFKVYLTALLALLGLLLFPVLKDRLSIILWPPSTTQSEAVTQDNPTPNSDGQSGK